MIRGVVLSKNKECRGRDVRGWKLRGGVNVTGCELMRKGVLETRS